MNLTPWERDRRIEQYARGPAPCARRLRRCRAGGDEVAAGPEPATAPTPRPTPTPRIRYLLTEEKPVIVSYDPDGWAREFDYTNHPLDAALALSSEPAQ